MVKKEKSDFFKNSWRVLLFGAAKNNFEQLKNNSEPQKNNFEQLKCR